MRLRKRSLGIVCILALYSLTFYDFKGKEKVDLLDEIIVDKLINEDNPELVKTALKLKISKINSQQKVYNEKLFGALNDNSTIILIQVHNRITYLEQLIHSLSKVQGISRTLLIFSHDFYDNSINHMILSIKFAKCMQIFFPYGSQVYPFEFPGEDMLDCAEKKDMNRKRKCEASYDSYGNIRSARLTQIKHHWWWNWNIIFNKLRVTRNHSGLVAYLEEDNYVIEDFLHVLDAMVGLRRHVDVYALGRKWPTKFYNNPSNEYFLSKWEMGGIAMSRSVWNRLRRCSATFCKHDDYNWDWSLIVSVSKCYPLIAMNLRFPRIYHIGLIGMHGMNIYKESLNTLDDVNDFVNNYSLFLYPERLKEMGAALNLNGKAKYGGWGDKRDHELCMKMID